MLMHIDMDAFFASIEQAINPALRGKPLIVGSRTNKYHTVVCATSYEAKRLGIDSGMSSKEAFRICPNALFVAADSARYVYVSEAIFSMLKKYLSELDYSSIDEFDLRFSPDQPVNYLQLGREIKERIRQRFSITCSIGIAPNWQLAKIGSKIEKPDGLVFIDETNYRAVLQNIPVAKICGAGPVMCQRFYELGIKTCGQLIAFPQDVLTANLGQSGLNLARSLDPHYQEFYHHTNQPAKSIGHSYTLPRETSNPHIIAAWIRLLSEMVSQRLRKSNLESKTVHLFIDSYQTRGFSRQKTFQTTVSLGIDIYQRAMGILGLKKGQKLWVKALGVSVSGLLPALQDPLLSIEKKQKNLAKTLDAINEKYGDWTVYHGILHCIQKNPINNQN